jgi:inorganic phosphate transporter, PiT family
MSRAADNVAGIALSGWRGELMSNVSASRHIHIPHWTQRYGIGAFLVIILVGIVYSITALTDDLVQMPSGTNFLVFLLLGVALLIALGFEFVNGFHDTANAVATVIYTHSLPAYIAVVWSGLFNFLGVVLSSGAVAFGIISLLPVELILQVGSHAGFAMVFALLIAAIIWNLGTWYLGLPSSSSHTLIGSIIGVGLMNQMMASGNSGTSGVDWAQATSIGKSLLVSPLVGFFAAGLLLLICKAVIRIPRLYEAPKGTEPPPWWIRAVLILTCTGVSFAHGSNDGQKGMGLIMLILIGTVPTAYALNHSVGKDQVSVFVSDSTRAVQVLNAHGGDAALVGDARDVLLATVEKRGPQDGTLPALSKAIADISASIAGYGSLGAVPTASTANVRNDMYLISETLNMLKKKAVLTLSAPEQDDLARYKKDIDNATKFIPTWVKVAVAIALGLGTMVGWKRIVITVGEKIGKSHLTYAQGASAELVAMATIGAADAFGLPVSTTHVLASGVAGTMAANRSGLQMSTVRNLLAAWVLTLPASIALAGGLFWLLRHLI